MQPQEGPSQLERDEAEILPRPRLLELREGCAEQSLGSGIGEGVFASHICPVQHPSASSSLLWTLSWPLVLFLLPFVS